MHRMLVKFYVLTAVLLVHLRGFYTEAIGADKDFMLEEELSNFNRYGIEGEEENITKIVYYQRQYLTINTELIIHESECAGASTSSSFTVFVGNLTPDGTLISWIVFKSKYMYYDYIEKTYWDMVNVPTDGLVSCLNQGLHDCFPRGDVVFVKYDNNPGDSWKIRSFEVHTYMALGPKTSDHHKFDGLITNMYPCTNVMDKKQLYQFGPLDGQFLEFPTRSLPPMNTRVL